MDEGVALQPDSGSREAEVVEILEDPFEMTSVVAPPEGKDKLELHDQGQYIASNISVFFPD